MPTAGQTEIRAEPAPPSVLRRHGGLVLLALWAVALVALYTLGNDFQIGWHLVENSKPRQVATNDYNFLHPQLLMLATRIVLMFSDPEHTRMGAVLAGRFVSALAASGSVVCLTILAWRLQGPLAAILTALLAGTSPLLFGLSHYMKEDTVLVFGLSAFLLALWHYGRTQNAATRTLLGLTAGLALSGKYIGGVAVGIALAIAIWENRTRPRQAATTCLWIGGCALAVFALVNLPMFTERYKFFHAFTLEMGHAVTDHHGMVRPAWSSFYGEALIRLASPLVILGYGYWLVQAWRQRRQWNAAILIIAMLPLAYLIMLQLAPLKTVRYLLPITTVATMLAACAAARVLTGPRPRWVRIIAAAAAALLLVFNLAGVARFTVAMTHDTRLQMAEWITANLPPDAGMAQTAICGLHDSSHDPGPAGVNLRIYSATELVESGSLDAVRTGGGHAIF